MANLTLSINLEIYNYETLYNIYKKLSSKIIDVRLETTDDISDRSRIIEGIFYINDNGSIVTIENIVFLHLLVFEEVLFYNLTHFYSLYQELYAYHIFPNY